MRPSYAVIWIRSLTKMELHALIADVKSGDIDATSRAVEFVAAESFGLWHNRARAKLCRYFKNHPPPDREITRLVDAIVARLVDGRFYEQFKDQLSMAVRLAPDRMIDAVKLAEQSDKDYVRRYADRLRQALASSSSSPRPAADAD